MLGCARTVLGFPIGRILFGRFHLSFQIRNKATAPKRIFYLIAGYWFWSHSLIRLCDKLDICPQTGVSNQSKPMKYSQFAKPNLVTQPPHRQTHILFEPLVSFCFASLESLKFILHLDSTTKMDFSIYCAWQCLEPPFRVWNFERNLSSPTKFPFLGELQIESVVAYHLDREILDILKFAPKSFDTIDKWTSRWDSRSL